MKHKYNLNKSNKIERIIADCNKTISENTLKYHEMVESLEPVVISHVKKIAKSLLKRQKNIIDVFSSNTFNGYLEMSTTTDDDNYNAARGIIRPNYIIEKTPLYNLYKKIWVKRMYEYDAESGCHIEKMVIKNTKLESVLENRSEYMNYLHHTISLVLKDLNFLENTVDFVVTKNSHIFTDDSDFQDMADNINCDTYTSELNFKYHTAILYFTSLDTTNIKDNLPFEFTLIPQHIIEKINYEEEADNFILSLKKMILEINLLNV